MSPLNEWTERLLLLAAESGWALVAYDARSPGYVLLEDSHGTTVRIESPAGLDTPYYVEHFKARPKDPPLKVQL